MFLKMKKASKKNNNIKNGNGNVNNKKIHTNKKTDIKTEKTEINTKNTTKNTLNNNSNHSTTQARDIKDDNEAANLIYSQTAERVLNGTLDLSNHPSKKDYEKFKETFNNNTAANPRIKAHAQQQMIKYEIWSQIAQSSQQRYEELIKAGKSPEEILKKHVRKGGTNWQVDLYNKHLEKEEQEKEEQKNQSLLSAINPVNWNVFKNEKSIEEKQQTVKTAILKGSQQTNCIQLSDVSTQKENYNSGAIKNKNMKTQVHQKF